jgi:hypothetical protein
MQREDLSLLDHHTLPPQLKLKSELHSSWPFPAGEIDLAATACLEPYRPERYRDRNKNKARESAVKQRGWSRPTLGGRQIGGGDSSR